MLNDNFLDIITLISFYIQLMNLNENLGQSDKQDILQEFSSKADVLLQEIHQHLQKQDEKIDVLLKAVKDYDNR